MLFKADNFKILLIPTLVGIAFLQPLLTNKDMPSVQTHKDTHLPETIITNVVNTRFNNGIVTMTVDAEELVQFPTPADTQLRHSKISLYQQGIRIWNIESNLAIIHQNNDISFSNNAIITEQNTIPPMILKTHALYYSQNNQTITSDVLVTTTKGKQRISATGMEIQLKTTRPERINLLSDVKIEYDPT